MSSNSRLNLYFIAIVPGLPIREDINSIKKRIHQDFHSAEALRSPPHITLHMPFKWKEDRENQLISGLSEFCSEQGPFDIELDGYGYFPRRVVFIKVLPSEVLQDLAIRVRRLGRRKWKLAFEESRPFAPHITVAFRDLNKEAFGSCWQQYKDQPFRSSFICCGITLLKHDGKKWLEHHQFSFSG